MILIKKRKIYRKFLSFYKDLAVIKSTFQLTKRKIKTSHNTKRTDFLKLQYNFLFCFISLNIQANQSYIMHCLNSKSEPVKPNFPINHSCDFSLLLKRGMNKNEWTNPQLLNFRRLLSQNFSQGKVKMSQTHQPPQDEEQSVSSYIYARSGEYILYKCKLANTSVSFLPSENKTALKKQRVEVTSCIQMSYLPKSD